MIPEEKQGHIGDFSEKTTDEIKDLLRRQNAIADNKKFIQRLPDKGEKIMVLIEQLKQELKQREKVDETADLFHQMSLDAERKARRAAGGDTERLGEIINTGEDDKMVIDERTKEDDKGPINSYERVIKKSKGKPQHRAKFYPNRSANATDVNQVKTQLTKDSNSSNRDVITLGDSSKSTSESTHGTFLTTTQPSPNRKEELSELSLSTKEHLEEVSRQKELSERLLGGDSEAVCGITGKETDMDSSVASSQLQESGQFSHKTLQDQGLQGRPFERLKYRYDENLESTTYGPPTRHGGAQLVDLHKSMQLLKDQTAKLEKLHAEQAAEKLSERFGVKLINPEGSSLKKYREVADTDDDTSGDENEAQDYPD